MFIIDLLITRRTRAVIYRAKEIISLSFDDMDALHIAFAEEARADYFVTCDDAIIKKAKGCQKVFKVRILGILEFLEEVLYYA